MNRIIIVRHGNTFEADETPRRIGAATDCPLTRTGERQSTRLGMWFAQHGFSFRRALCGTSARAQQTAALIMEHQNAGICLEEAEWLTEIDHGPDENLPEDRVVARLGRPVLDAWDQHALIPSGWTVDPERRMAGWRALYDDAPSGDILTVTSNGVARFALLALPGLKPAGSMKLRTAAFGIVAFDRHGAATREAWDQRPC